MKQSDTSTTSRRDLIIGSSALGMGALCPALPALAQNSGDVMPIRLAVDYGTKTFKVYQKAAIVSYPILFIRSAFGKAGNLGLYLEMEGPTEADMKALATEAHDDLSRQLAAAGYEMIPGLDVARHRDIVAKGAVPGNGLWDSGVPDPYGQRGWYATSADAASMFGRIGKLDVRSDFGLPWELRGVSRDLGAMMIMPKLLFDFSSAGGASRLEGWDQLLGWVETFSLRSSPSPLASSGPVDLDRQNMLQRPFARPNVISYRLGLCSATSPPSIAQFQPLPDASTVARAMTCFKLT
jgi:hypothetical protein